MTILVTMTMNPDAHVLGMTQYYVGNFNEKSSPRYVTTCDVDSCIVVILRQMTEKEVCAAFGMAHLNLTNVYFLDVGMKNLQQFVSEYTKVGGDLKPPKWMSWVV